MLRLSSCGTTLEPDSGTRIALLLRLRVKDAAHVKCQTEDIGAPVPYYSSWYAVLGSAAFVLDVALCGTRSPKPKSALPSHHAALSVLLLRGAPGVPLSSSIRSK